MRRLARRYPAITVEADPIFLQDGRFFTTVAAACGIASAEVLRCLFQRRLGVSPSDYRGCFRSAS